VIEAMREQLDMRYRWLERTIERMEERKQRGDNFVEMQTGELQHVFQELLSMHLRCDRLENMLAEFAGVYQRPSLIVPKELL
jgi:hypothetical protein